MCHFYCMRYFCTCTCDAGKYWRSRMTVHYMEWPRWVQSLCVPTLGGVVDILALQVYTLWHDMTWFPLKYTKVTRLWFLLRAFFTICVGFFLRVCVCVCVCVCVLGCWRHSRGSGCCGDTASRVPRGGFHPWRAGHQVKACGCPNVSRLWVVHSTM